MYREVFETIGTVLIWASTGFKGKFSELASQDTNYNHAIIGLVFFLTSLLLTLFILSA
jgi:hypothetical protein